MVVVVVWGATRRWSDGRLTVQQFNMSVTVSYSYFSQRL